MDIEKIEEEAKQKLIELFKKYNIKETLEDLIEYYSSIYVHKDFKQKRYRLLGIKAIYSKDEKEGKIKNYKKKTVQLYVLSKRMIQTLPEDSVYEISKELAEITYYFSVLKKILDLKFTVEQKNTQIMLNSINIKDYSYLKK